MFPTPTAFEGRLCPALAFALVLAAAGCERPADEVEPTPAPIEVQVPGALRPPMIEPALPPTDPSVPPAPDPRGPAAPPELDQPKVPATVPSPSQAVPTG